MAIIKSGATSDQLTIDPTSKAARMTLYDTSGNSMGTSSTPLPVRTARPYTGTFTGDYLLSTYRSVGAAGLQNLFSLWNPVGSGKNIALRRLFLQADHTTLLATACHIATSTVTVQPTGGTAGIIHKVDSSYSNTIVEAKGLASSDGTNGTAITATAVGRIFQQFCQRPHTLAGWFTCDDVFLIPERCIDYPLIIKPGEGLLVHTLQNATTGAFYVVNGRYDEYTA